MSGAAMELLKALCSLSSMFMNLSPLPSMYRIYKSKSCGEVQVLPLLSLWGSCHIWMLYGFLSDNIFPLFLTCLAGSALAIGYLSVYFWYTLERPRVRKLLAGVLLWNGVILVLSFSGKSFLGITNLPNKDTGDWVGYIAVATSIVLYASPFATLSRVIRTKSVASIPIEMVVVGTITNAIWVVYAVLEWDAIVFFPNAISVFFGCVQTIVYAVVRRQHAKIIRAEELEKKDKDATGLSTIELDRSSTIITDGIGAHAFQALQSPV